MELQLERSGDHPYIHHIEDQAIALVHKEEGLRITQSFILTENRVIQNWQVNSVAALNTDTLGPILELDPEVVVIGTGKYQRFPSREVMASFLSRGIGVEPMDNKAAARTHAILISEERQHVVAAFILPKS